jgi:predicted RNA binding protein YcfA (HicA-like mRNA interferase family)
MASAAEKLLERMRQSKHGWGQDDLHQLYVGFGFAYRDKGKHRVYTHPRRPELIATVARHNKLPIGYIQHAIALIDRLNPGQPQ